MANRRSKPEPLRTEIKQFKTSAEIDRAIAKLKNRIDDVKNLDPRQIRYDDQRVYNVQDAISNTILEVFGPNSPEHNRNDRVQIRYGPALVSNKFLPNTLGESKLNSQPSAT